MSLERFDHFLKSVEPLISKQETNFWKPISAGIGIGRPYHLKFFKGCLRQILLGPFYIQCCLENLLATTLISRLMAYHSKRFRRTVNLPHVVGALDRKHIRIHCNPISQLQGIL